jgi:hypothetical protein
MRKEKQYVEDVSIQQIANGYCLIVGSSCTGVRENYVFQTFTELVNFLNKHFTHREEIIYTDAKNQDSIELN